VVARKAPEDEGTPSVADPNVIDMAQARSAHARRRLPVARPDGERVAAAVFDALPGSLALLDSDGVVLAANRAWATATPACDVGADFFRDWHWDALEPIDAVRVIAGVRAALTGSESLTHDCIIDGLRVLLVATALAGERGGAVLTITSPADQHDPVTGLSARARFIERLDGELGRDDGTISVLVVKLLGFKLVNQAYGHAVGDELLADVGQRLVGTVASAQDVGHLGGTEFAVLARNRSARLATTVAERLLEPFVIGAHEVHLGARVGCRVARAGEGERADAVLRDAVAAMRDAKERSTDGVAFFTEQTRAGVERHAALERDLRRAVEHGELVLAYQPLVDVRTGRVGGAEALARWDHETLGAISPGEFIPIAESSGVIRRLGEWVLEETCREMARWKRTIAEAPESVSVNVSALQLADRGFAQRVSDVLTQHGLRPQELCLELTESTLLASQEQGIDALHELHELGTCIALDDFGTGHSSLARLRALPVDLLKIDRSFVVGLDAHEQDRAIAAAVMDLARALGLRTVAEGVETDEQARQLSELGCHVVQGWLYARAVPADDLLPLCRTGFPALRTAQIDPVSADHPATADPQEGNA